MQGTWQACINLLSFPSGLDTSSVTNMHTTWRGCYSLTEFPSIDVSANIDFGRTWENCLTLSTFNPFINTTYTSAKWVDTWKDSNVLAFTSEAASPFANIGLNTIPVSDLVSLFDPSRGLHDALPSGSTYYPPFDVSGVSEIHIDDVGTTITDFNLIGWDQMTFNNVEFGNDPNPTVEIDINATLANTEVDNILNQLYSNLSNHTQIQGTSTYSINFHSNVRTLASDTAINGLIAAGWTIAHGGTTKLEYFQQVGDTITSSTIGHSKFGASVSMNGDGTVFAVGEPNSNASSGGFGTGGSTAMGIVKVYENVNDTWIQRGSNIFGMSISFAGNQRGLSISDDSNTIAFTMECEEINNANGDARVYRWREFTANDVGLYNYTSVTKTPNSTESLIATGGLIPQVGTKYWTQVGDDIEIVPGLKQPRPISLSGNGSELAIGDSRAPGAGKIYFYGITETSIFHRIDSTVTDFIAPAVLFTQILSISLSYDGKRIAIGTQKGLVVCERQTPSSSWSRSFQTTGGGAWQTSVDGFGHCVSLSGDGLTVAVGAPQQRAVVPGYSGGNNNGQTHIFRDDGSAHWDQLTAIRGGELRTGIDGVTTMSGNDQSGSSVSLNYNGTVVAIGSPLGDNMPLSTSFGSHGFVKIFQQLTGPTHWEEIINGRIVETLEDAESGRSVSLNNEGNIVAIGAPGSYRASVGGTTASKSRVSVYKDV
tara:strand:+ start:108 stop:2237 length:2130 start_codon:yes stop_codon:yes gene_type:complete